MSEVRSQYSVPRNPNNSCASLKMSAPRCLVRSFLPTSVEWSLLEVCVEGTSPPRGRESPRPESWKRVCADALVF